jgi:lysophospholipase L1-like esterase
MISSYSFFQAKLYPVLPFLLYQAMKVKRLNPLPPAMSEQLHLGKGEKKILVLGESTAAGVGASKVETSLGGRLYELLGSEYQLTNFGKNGLKAIQLKPQFGVQISSVESPLEGIFLFLGANDCFRLTQPKEFRTVLIQVIADLHSDFSPKWIYLADIPPVHHFPAFPVLLKSYLRAQRSFLRKEMQDICAADSRLVFDPLEFSFHPEFFATDGIHPSDKGYGQIASFAFSGLKTRGLV